jgi:phage FluMu gp28-like protein
MWTAARPCITWGFPLRILSTHNGQNCRYFKFIDAVKKQKLQWSLHTTPIQLAVEEGLADKILKRKLTPEERDAWIEEQRESCFDEQTWQQEYCCIPVDEAEAFLTYDLIGSCRADGLEQPLDATTGYLYGGMDIGRKRDLSVIWVVERLGRALLTRTVRILEKTPFRDQRDVLFKILKHPRLRRFCIDSTGLGMQLAEEALEAFGRYRIEAVTFTGPVKEDLAYGVRNMMEDRLLYIPDDPAITEDLHSVRKLTTSSGNVRFDVAYSDAGGHADRMWACALAVHAAADKTSGPIHVATRKRREAAGMFRGYD